MSETIEYSPLDDYKRIRKVRKQQIAFDLIVGFSYNLTFSVIFGVTIYDSNINLLNECEGSLLTWATVTFWYTGIASFFSFHSFILTILAFLKQNVFLARLATVVRLSLSLAGVVVVIGISISYLYSKRCDDLETVTFYYIILPSLSIISAIVIILFCFVSLCLIKMAQRNS